MSTADSSVSAASGLAIPAFAALAAACAFGVAAALQHQQAGLARRSRGLRLLADVARRPLSAAVVAVAGIAMLGPSLAAVQAAGAAHSPGAAGAASGQEAPVPAQIAYDARAPGATQRSKRAQPGRQAGPHRPPRLRPQCDLLRVGGETTTAEDRADQLRS
jgi:hypothetical protein